MYAWKPSSGAHQYKMVDQSQLVNIAVVSENITVTIIFTLDWIYIYLVNIIFVAIVQRMVG